MSGAPLTFRPEACITIHSVGLKNKATKLLKEIDHKVREVVSNGEGAIPPAVAAACALAYDYRVLREEVPCERYYSLQVANKKLTLKAYAWNILYASEGCLRVIGEGAIHIFKKMTETVFKSTYKVSSQRHFEVLEAQWHGLKVNFRLIVSPRKTFESLQSDQVKLGESSSKWKWGTAYAGGPRTFLIIGNYASTFDEALARYNQLAPRRT